MCFWYSLRVVAPTQRSSPRASMGFSMFEASIEPSAAPAPTTVCSSSMKRTTSPLDSWTSLSTAFSRSSNSPRYLAPAMRAPRSSATTRLFLSDSGMSPFTMRWARPSTIAVLPTPGSPMRTGLFLVRRERTWTTRRTSSSRPITGSSFPLRASSVRSRPYFSRAWYRPSAFGSSTVWLPRISLSALRSASRVAPARTRASAAGVFAARIASNRCSVETYWSLSASASRIACLRTPSSFGETCVAEPCVRGREARLCSTCPASCPAFSPSLLRAEGTTPPSCSRSVFRRCSVVTSGWSLFSARVWAAVRASCAFTVN